MDNNIFVVPTYNYTINIIHPLLEIYRYKIINKFIGQLNRDIVNKIKQLRNSSIPKIKINKIKQYFSQLIMNILVEKTYNTGNEIIKLDDGLLNYCDIKDSYQFYEDLNYYFRTNIFSNDEFGIVKSVTKMINKISHFGKKIINETQQIFMFKNFVYQLDVGVLKRYNLYDSSITKEKLILNKNIIHSCQKKYVGPVNKFYDYLLCCLIRYVTLGSGANQFAVDLNYKKILRRKFNLNFECFASVFNHYYDNYCSMFYDIEKYFGSSGSFMCLQIKQGFYMANPPYDDNLLTKMYIKIKSSLDSKLPVAFIMSIPQWDKYKLEEIIDSDKLFYAKKIKHELFEDLVNGKTILIPPYISYLFFNDAYINKYVNIVKQIANVFSSFKNVTHKNNSNSFHVNKKSIFINKHNTRLH